MRPKQKKFRASSPVAHNASTPKYSIAVASDLSGVPQQQLRRMEEGGLITPMRTEGNTRRYSDADLSEIAEILSLTERGINMEGIRSIRALQEELAVLRAENAALRAEIERLQLALRKPTTTEGAASS